MTKAANVGNQTTMEWGPEEVRALGVRTTLDTSNSVLGLSRTYGYRLAKEGRYPVPLLALGRKYVVPVAGLLKALCIEDGINENPTKASA